MSARKRGELSMNDLIKFWTNLGNNMPVHEVCDWIIHGVQLPSYNQTFYENQITGFDLPTLLEKDADEKYIIETELNIKSKIHQKQLLRAIRMKLFGIGDEPPTPLSFHCHPGPGSIKLEWEEGIESDVLKGKKSQKTFLPIHKYRIQARAYIFPDDIYGGGWTKWVDIYESNTYEYLHESLQLGDTLQYRIQSWNIIGHSNWSKPSQCTVIHPPKIKSITLDSTQNSRYSEALQQAVLEQLQKYNHSNNEATNNGIMYIFYKIIDLYHAFSAFLQVCVAISSLIALIYYTYHTYILNKSQVFKDIVNQSIDDIPIPVPAPSSNSKAKKNKIRKRLSLKRDDINKQVAFDDHKTIQEHHNNIIKEVNKTKKKRSKKRSIKKDKIDLTKCHICKKN